MISGADIQLLREGEQVLSLFLHDVLSSVSEDYFESVVVPYINSDVYRGTATAVNKRGVKKTSLREFDLQFLLQLLEFSIDRRKSASDRLVMPDITSFLSFTQSAVYHKVRSVVSVRNDWVHAEIESYDETRRAIDITKLLDLYREEILHAVMSREDIFSSETRQAAQVYAKALSEALLGRTEETSAVEQELVSIRDPQTTPRSWLDSLPVRRYAPAIVGVLIVGFLSVLWLNGKSEQSPPTLHIAVCEPLAPLYVTSARNVLKDLVQRLSLQWIVVHSTTSVTGIRLPVGRTTHDVEAIVAHLQKAPRLETAFQLRGLFGGAIPSMNAGHDTSGSLLVLGSVGEFTRLEEKALVAVPDTLYPAGTGTVLRKRKVPLMFLRMGPRTEADNRVLNGFKEANVTCEEIVL